MGKTDVERYLIFLATHSRRLEPPVKLPLKKRNCLETEICELGRVSFQDRNERFGILTEDRFRHLFIVSKTGNGKSTVMQNAILSDMQNGNGLAVVDPHGDLADFLLTAVPGHRTNDVILIDPSDLAFPVSFNPLDVEPALIDLAVWWFRQLNGRSMVAPPPCMNALRLSEFTFRFLATFIRRTYQA